MGDQKCHPRSPLIIKLVMDETKVREGDKRSFTEERKFYLPRAYHRTVVWHVSYHRRCKWCI